MNKILEVSVTIWHLALFAVIGAVFNSFIAFSTLFWPPIALVTATLTGYGIFVALKGKKRDN